MIEDAEMRLRAHGLHVTAQRLAVLASLAACPHGTADEVLEEVRARIGSVSRQAVFDALGTLSERGVIRRVQPARSSARYEVRIDDNHHHLVCRRCARMVDIDCAKGSRPCLDPIDDHDFVIDEAEVIYWGVCPVCRQSTAEQVP